MNLVANNKNIKGKRALPKPKLSVKNTFRLLWVYLRSFKNWILAELGVSLVVMMIGVGNYFAMQYAILALEQGQTHMVMVIGAILITLFFLMWGCTYAQYTILVHVGQNVGQKIRNDVFSKVQKLPIKYFDTHNSGDLMSRFTNDVNAITTALAENMTDVIGNTFWTIGMGIVMFVMSPYLSLITVALVPIFMIVIIVLVKKSQPIFGKQQIALGALNGFLEEYLSGQNVVDLYSQGDQAMKKYQKYIKDVHEVSYKAQLYSGLLVPWGAFMTGFISLFITVLGIVFIVTDVGLGGVAIELKLGDAPTNPSAENGFVNPEWASQFASLTIYLVLLKYFVQPFSQIANVLNIFQAAIAGANRAFDVFKEYEEVNPLERIVINIAGSNLPIDEQRAILQAKLDNYSAKLHALDAKLGTYPKFIKKEDIKWIESWIININSIRKAYHKNKWTLNIFKRDSQLNPNLLTRINWFRNQLIDIDQYIDENIVEAQEIYQYIYDTFSKQGTVFDVDHLPNDKQKAHEIVDILFDKLDTYLLNQVNSEKYEVTNHNVKCFQRFKVSVLELEHEKIKLTHYMYSHFTFEQRKQIIANSKLSLHDKDDLITIDSFETIATKFIQMLKTVEKYYNDELKLHGQKTFDENHECIEETNKLKLRQMYDDTLADYHMTVKSLAMFDSKTIHDIHANITLDHLTFSYDGLRDILKDINLDVKAGQTIAIVGPTGSGKSTIINLLTKFYEIEKGDIKFDNQFSIREITKESLRRNISIVLQDTYLFNETVKENIRFGNLEATDDMIINAAKLANCHEFIMNLPNGYDTILENNGEGLSQGQRQLLAIARAILSQSSVLILDEATSSIDTKTEKDIQVAMERLMQNKTTFMIAHRLSTVRNATKIVVLKDGEIIEVGNHDELLEIKDGFYAKLYNSQFGDDLDLEV